MKESISGKRKLIILHKDTNQNIRNLQEMIVQEVVAYQAEKPVGGKKNSSRKLQDRSKKTQKAKRNASDY